MKRILEKIKHILTDFMNNNMIMNWSNINKCILIQLLGLIDIILWVLWWGISNSHQNLKPWINQDFFPILFRAYCLFIFGFIVLIFLTWKCGKNALFNKLIPYITVAYFGIAFIYGGYAIGVMNPASIAGYVSLVTVGLILFERKVLYLTVVPIAFFFLITIIQSLYGHMVYAPIFSDLLKSKPPYQNEFWVYSVMYFYIPIFLASIVLFEILLTQWRNRERMIQQMSLVDPLTGIFNRRKISENIDILKQQHSSFSIVLLDLDFFKSINDHYGHDVGDIVLKHIATILTENIREQGVVGRFGGEEFIILVPDGQLPHVMDIAERCRQAIEKNNIPSNLNFTLKVTASFGVAVSTNSVVIAKEEVLRQADQALYLAKRNGRNQVRHYFELETTPLNERRQTT